MLMFFAHDVAGVHVPPLPGGVTCVRQADSGTARRCGLRVEAWSRSVSVRLAGGVGPQVREDPVDHRRLSDARDYLLPDTMPDDH